MPVEARQITVLELRKMAIPLATVAAKEARCLRDDILNEACLIALTRPDFLQGPNPEASFLLIVGNVGKRYVAEGAHFNVDREQVRHHVSGMRHVSDADEFINEAHRAEAITALREEIERLPKRERRVLQLHLSELSLTQISLATGQPEGSIRNQYTQGKIQIGKSGRLRQLFEHLSAFPAFLWGKAKEVEARLGLPAKVAAFVGLVGVLWIGLAAALMGEDRTNKDNREPRPQSGLQSKQGLDQQSATGAREVASAVVDQVDERSEAAPNEGIAPRKSGTRSEEPSSSTPPSAVPESKPLPPELRAKYWEDADSALDYRVSYWPETMIPIKIWTERNGKFHGKLFRFREDGTLQQISEFYDGAQHGLIEYFDPTGTVVTRWSRWDYGKLVERGNK